MASLLSPVWIQGLYKDEDYSDLTIRCGPTEWRVHKTVVCTQSSFFKTACKDAWKKNGTSGIIQLDEIAPEVVHEVIKFLYLSTYDDPTIDSGPIQFNYKMFVAADKYDIPALADLAEERFNDSLTSFKDDQDFIDAIPLLYDEAPVGALSMRRNVVKIAQYNFTTTQEEDSAFRQAVYGMVQVIPGFATDLVHDLGARVQNLTWQNKEMSSKIAAKRTGRYESD